MDLHSLPYCTNRGARGRMYCRWRYVVYTGLNIRETEESEARCEKRRRGLPRAKTPPPKVNYGVWRFGARPKREARTGVGSHVSIFLFTSSPSIRHLLGWRCGQMIKLILMTAECESLSAFQCTTPSLHNPHMATWNLPERHEQLSAARNSRSRYTMQGQPPSK